jgi:hypothetical protein
MRCSPFAVLCGATWWVIEKVVFQERGGHQLHGGERGEPLHRHGVQRFLLRSRQEQSNL